MSVRPRTAFWLPRRRKSVREWLPWPLGGLTFVLALVAAALALGRSQAPVRVIFEVLGLDVIGFVGALIAMRFPTKSYGWLLLALGLAFGAQAVLQVNGVDRRFDRARYDAGRAVDVFAARLREQPDLDEVIAGLCSSEARTVAPTSVGIWLCGSSLQRGAPR